MSYPVYCINLEHRKDRKEHTLNEFHTLGLENVIYPHFIKDIKGGIYGCYDSHMKVWNDFFFNYPTSNYCLVFEDDFVSSKESHKYIRKAIEFIHANYNDIDMLFLHNIRVDVDNKINTHHFTNGYGIQTHSYFITRKYIKRIIRKNNGVLPIPNGYAFDNEINLNKKSILYSKKIFYTNKKCFTQLINTSSDIISNTMDEQIRGNDINISANQWKNIYTILNKKIKINDNAIKDLNMFSLEIRRIFNI